MHHALSSRFLYNVAYFIVTPYGARPLSHCMLSVLRFQNLLLKILHPTWVPTPTFNGTDKASQEGEARLLIMDRYFKIHEYFEKEKARISIFSLNGRALIWWEHLMEVKGIKERKFDWE